MPLDLTQRTRFSKTTGKNKRKTFKTNASYIKTHRYLGPNKHVGHQGLHRPVHRTSCMSYNLPISLGGVGPLGGFFLEGGNGTSFRPLHILHIEIKMDVTAPSDGDPD